MLRSWFLAFAALVPLCIGLLAAGAPGALLALKGVEAPSPEALVMARTAGVLLVALGALNLRVAWLPDGPAVRAVIGADLLVQLLLLPVDPWAWAQGAFHGLGSFVPNSVLHVGLAGAFGILLWQPPLRALRPDGSGGRQGGQERAVPGVVEEPAGRDVRRQGPG